MPTRTWEMPRPFLKWAGGKAKLAPLILSRAPKGFTRYHEPFLGAGAVYFALMRERPVAAALTDVNGLLIETYGAVRDGVEQVIRELGPLAERYLAGSGEERRGLYYAVRASEPSTVSGKAARMIFLNKTCYNGLYRENRQGGFNVPHGRYVRPAVLDAALLRSCSEALRGAALGAGDFEAACDAAAEEDFVYLDPPYHPLSATSSFTAYTRNVFGMAEQVRLRDSIDRLTRKGVPVMLSNSDHPAIRELYAGRGYRMDAVPMGRSINSVGGKRTPVTELLLTNFE